MRVRVRACVALRACMGSDVLSEDFVLIFLVCFGALIQTRNINTDNKKHARPVMGVLPKDLVPSESSSLDDDLASSNAVHVVYSYYANALPCIVPVHDIHAHVVVCMSCHVVPVHDIHTRGGGVGG
jgi:hypothetical protein